MKKLILTVGIAALFAGTSVMAGHHHKSSVGLSLVVVQDGAALGCLGYAGKAVVQTVNVDVTPKHRHHMTVICNYDLDEIPNLTHASGKNFMCLMSNLDNESISHGKAVNYTIDADTNIATTECVFRGRL